MGKSIMIYNGSYEIPARASLGRDDEVRSERRPE